MFQVEKELTKKLKKEFDERRGVKKIGEKSEFETVEWFEVFVTSIDYNRSKVVVFGGRSGCSSNVATDEIIHNPIFV